MVIFTKKVEILESDSSQFLPNHFTSLRTTYQTSYYLFGKLLFWRTKTMIERIKLSSHSIYL